MMSVLISPSLRSIARNAGQITGARIIGPVLQAGYVVLLATYLGPELFGLLAYSRSWYLALLPISILGLGAILSRAIGADRAQAPEVVAQGLTLRVLATALVALTCAAGGYLLEPNPIAQDLIAVFSLALAARAIGMFAEHIFVAFESSGYILRQEALFRPLEVGLGSIALVLGGGALGVALIHTSTWIIQAGRGLYMVHSRLVPLQFAWSWATLATLLRQGLVIGIAVSGTIWFLQSPLLLYRLAGASEFALGQMGLALQLLGLAATLPMSIGAAAMPSLSRAVARGDRKEMLFLDGTCRLALVLGAVIALTVSSGGPWIVKVVFGASYGKTAELLGPILWLLVPFTIGHAAQTVLFARVRQREALFWAGTGALALTVSLLPLVWTIGALGVVLAAWLGMGTWALGSLIAVARPEPAKLGRSLFRSVAAVALSVSVFWAMSAIGPWQAWLGSMATLLAAGLILGVVSSDERAVLYGIVRRRKTDAADGPHL